METIEITYGSDTVTLTCDLAQASAPLRVDGDDIGYQTADARHRTDLAVALACSRVWPERDWPSVPSAGSVSADWSEGSEAWDEMGYRTVDVAAAENAARRAIERSASHNEIVHVAYDVELRAELGDACEDSVGGNDEIEFWGTTDAGDEWRVHMERQG